MRPLHPPAIVAGLCATLAFCAVCGFRLPSFLAAVAMVVGLALRGRFNLPVRLMLAGSGAVLLVVWLLAEPMYPGGQTYVSSYSFRAALAATIVLGLGPMFLYTTMRERGYLCAAVGGLMIALISYAAVPFFIFCVGLQMLALAAVQRRNLPAAHRSLPAYLTLLPILLVAAAISVALQWSENKVNLIFSLLTAPPGMSFSFPSKTRLSTLSRSQSNPAVIVRYFSAQPPSYLVARCYSDYSQGAWNAPEETVTLDGKDSLYELFSQSGTQIEDRVELAGAGVDRLAPRDAGALVVTSAQLQRAWGDCLQLPRGLDVRNYLVRRAPGNHPREFGRDAREPHLAVAAELRPTLVKLGDEWSGKASSAIQRCKLLEAYFQEHFQYGFGYPFTEKQEPVLSFLNDRPAAHCEMFASSLALMLRCYSIPTRYVNGFIVKERSPFSAYSIVRGRHAHAWVEAYIEGTGWILLDPTPPQFTQPEEDLTTRLQDLSDAFFYYWSRLTSMSWQDLLLGTLSWLRRWGIPLAGLYALYWLWRSGLGFSWKKGVVSEGEATREAAGLILRDVEVLLQKVGLSRPGNQTLLTWSAQLEIPHVPAFLLDYCEVRYGKTLPEAEDLARLEQRRTEIAAWVTAEMIPK